MQKPTLPENSFDVLVIGAGIGGLSSAVLLARKGYRVCVIESHDKAGGLASSWERIVKGQRFIFSAGVQDISGFGISATFDNLFANSPFRDEIRWLRTDQRYIEKFGTYDVPDGLENFIELLKKHFPENSTGLDEMFAELKRLFLLTRNERLKFVLENKAQEFVGDIEEIALISRQIQEPYLSFLSRYISNPQLKNLLTNVCNYLTDTPEQLSLGNALALFAYYLDGGNFPAGGIRQLADLLVREIQFLFGTVRFRTTAQNILPPNPENGEIVVLSGEKQFRAKAIVANKNVSATFRDFFATLPLPFIFKKRLASRTSGPSAILLNIALDRIFDIPEHTFVRTGKRTFAIANPSRKDSSLAPEGCSAMSAITFLSNEEAVRWLSLEKENYREEKKLITKEFLKEIETAFPEIAGHILHVETATPKTFKRFTHVPDGMIYGHAFGEWMPQARCPVPWLFFAGADINFGPGVEAAAISGFSAAKCVHEFLSQQTNTAPSQQ